MHYPLRIELRPSRRMIRLSAAIHLVAAFAFVAGAFHPAAVACALGLLGWSWRRSCRAEEAKGLGALTLDDDGGLRLERVSGNARARALGSSADFGWALWLHWEGIGQARRRGAMMLLPDNVPPHAWRGLRIWLRHKLRHESPPRRAPSP